MIVYLSGPITGIKDANIQSFAEAEAEMVKRGYDVLNPHHNFGGRLDLDRHNYMRVDIGHILAANFVLALPGWGESVGCRTEIQVAFQIGTLVRRYLGPKWVMPIMLPRDLTDAYRDRS